MKRPRRHSLRRRIAASIACLAFVLQGLVPAFAHAAASVVRGQFHPGQICSIDPQGARLRLAAAIDAAIDAAVDADGPAPAPALPSAAHCPFCALPLGADAPAPDARAWNAGATDAGVEVPAAGADAPPPPRARGRPQAPRAPPLG